MTRTALCAGRGTAFSPRYARKHSPLLPQKAASRGIPLAAALQILSSHLRSCHHPPQTTDPRMPGAAVSGRHVSVSPIRSAATSRHPASLSSTRTACHPPPTINLPGGTFWTTRVTSQARSKNTRSIANRMPTVCTARQRSISNAASGPNARHPSRPRNRVNHVAARAVRRTQTSSPRIMQPYSTTTPGFTDPA